MEEKIPEIIKQIVEEDEVLKEKERELQKEILSLYARENPDFVKIRKIWENTPGARIAKILVQVLDQKVPVNNLKERLEQELEISEQRAIEIETKIKERILNPMIAFSQKEEISHQKESQAQKATSQRSYDPYREPIEGEVEIFLPTEKMSHVSREEEIEIEREIKKDYKLLIEEEEKPFSDEEIQRESKEKIFQRENLPEIRIQKRERKFQREGEEKKESYFKSRKIDPYREIPE